MAQPQATRDNYPVGFPDHDNSWSQGFRFVTKGKDVSAKATGDKYSIGCPDQHYTKVYVRNFGKDYDSYKLATTFEKFGKIVSAEVMTDETGKCRGFGFVNFETHDAAAKAVQAMQGGLVNGRQVYCGPAHKKERQKELVSSCTHGTAAKHTSSTGSARQGTLRAEVDFPRKETNQDQGVDQHYKKVYVKNFGNDFPVYKLATTFEKFGKVLIVELWKTDETEKCRGFAFVSFETHDAAAKAVEAIQGALVNGRQVHCGPVHKKREQQKELVRTRGTPAKHSTGSALQGCASRTEADFPRKQTIQHQGFNQRYTNVFVKNFGKDMDSDKLMITFEKFGKITMAEVMTDETGKCRGFGFVNFETHDAAVEAVEAMEGSVVNGRQIYCRPAQKNDSQIF